jgi:hypothetical protein
LHIPKRRVPTRPPPQVKEQRLAEKRRKSTLKGGRGRKRPEDE